MDASEENAISGCRIGLFAGAALLLATLGWTEFPTGAGTAGHWVQFLGRFHPVTLHVPIGLYVGLCTVETIGLLNPQPGLRTAARVLLGLTALTSVLAACLGMLLLAGGEYTSVSAFRHKWLGLAFAGGTLGLLAVRLKALEQGTLIWRTLTPFLLIGLLILMSLAGHYGGNLTHGAGYLTEYAPDWLKLTLETPEESVARDPADEEDIYRETVEPFFEAYCVKCHGPEKQKSDYRLDSYEGLLVAGKNGEPPIVPFEPHNSFLIQLLWLHESDILAMPPEGKARPSAEEMLAITHWVSLGAQGPLETEEATQARVAEKARWQKAVQTLEADGVVVLPLGLDKKGYYVDVLNVEAPLSDEAWAQLVLLKDRIAELKLAGTEASADQWNQLAHAAQLTDVDLSHATNVDHAMDALNTLPSLRRLNLFGSDLTGSGLSKLDVSGLSALYLGGTAVPEDVIVALRETYPDRKILGKPDLTELDAIAETTKTDSTRFDPTKPANK